MQPRTKKKRIANSRRGRNGWARETFESGQVLVVESKKKKKLYSFCSHNRIPRVRADGGLW